MPPALPATPRGAFKPGAAGAAKPTAATSAAAGLSATLARNFFLVFFNFYYQKAEFMEVFNLMDKDGGGTISFDEMRFVMNGIGARPTDEELQELLFVMQNPGDPNILQTQPLPAEPVTVDPEQFFESIRIDVRRLNV
jgi:hypothetical protein